MAPLRQRMPHELQRRNCSRSKDLAFDDLTFPEVPYKMPTVLSQEEVVRLIDSAPNRLYRILLVLLARRRKPHGSWWRTSSPKRVSYCSDTSHTPTRDIGEHAVSYFIPVVCVVTADCGSVGRAGGLAASGASRATTAGAQLESKMLSSDQGLPARS